MLYPTILSVKACSNKRSPLIFRAGKTTSIKVDGLLLVMIWQALVQRPVSASVSMRVVSTTVQLSRFVPKQVEYKSGIGNFAKYFNGGKPFVDDLKLEIVDGAVQVRSSSRVGDSDFKVNQKRLLYLGSALQAKGWDVPTPNY